MSPMQWFGEDSKLLQCQQQRRLQPAVEQQQLAAEPLPLTAVVRLQLLIAVGQRPRIAQGMSMQC